MRVAITKCSEYSYFSILDAIREISENTDFPDVKGKKILVKPNILSDAKPEAGITTHPIVVKAVIELLKEKGAEKIYCGDSPGLHTPHFKGRLAGIEEVCLETGAIWVDFTKDHRVHKLSNMRTKVNMAGILDEVDFTISVAKFKTHQLMYATGCVKNCFGLLPGLNKSPCHVRYPNREAFARLIVNIYKEAKCAYSFMDGIIGMEGPGPANGTLRHVGYLLGGKDAFAVDLAEATIMGYRCDDIPILNVGKFLKMTDLKAEYPLLDANDLVISDYRRINVEKKSNLFSALLLPYLKRSSDKKKAQKRNAPVFDREKCIHCLRCQQICPAEALSFKEEGITIDTHRCIRCYCCHEICPADAITI